MLYSCTLKEIVGVKELTLSAGTSEHRRLPIGLRHDVTHVVSDSIQLSSFH